MSIDGETSLSLMESRDPELARVELDMARTREKVALAVIALQRELRRTVDWREWIRRKPGIALTVAFGLGFLLGRRD